MGLNDFIKLGDNIKKLRKEKGLSRKSMAEDILKIPRSTYSNYENNNRVPDKEMLIKIAKALDTDPTFLLGFNDMVKDALKRNETEVALIELFKTIDCNIEQIMTITPPENDNDFHNYAIEEYVIEFNNKTFSMTVEEFLKLQDEIKSYMKFKINQFLENYDIDKK